MSLSRSQINRMPTGSIRQVKRKEKAEQKLRSAQDIENKITSAFKSTMAMDQSRSDKCKEPDKVVLTSHIEAEASVTEDGRRFYEKDNFGGVSYTRQNMFSTTYGTCSKIVEMEMKDQGDRTCFTQTTSYSSSSCPYPTERVTVVRSGDADDPTYNVYNGWLMSTLAKTGII